MAQLEAVNRYNGPCGKQASPEGRYPAVAAKAILGWSDHMEAARGFAATARKTRSPKEKIAVAIMAVAQYNFAIEKMSDYNSTHADPGVAKKIKQAKSEMDDLTMQIRLGSD